MWVFNFQGAFVVKYFGLLLVIFISGCGNYNKIKNPNSFIPKAIDNSPTDFAKVSRLVLKPYCIDCHKGQHKAYVSYGIVKSQAAGILARIQPQAAGRMPEGGPPLDPQLVQLFADWVKAGAPEFSKSTTPTSPTSTITFAEVKEKVFKKYNCTECHSQYNSYYPVKQKIGAIVSLVTENKMPFARKKGEAVEFVSDADKKLLLDWANQGAPAVAGHTGEFEVPALQPTWVSLRDQVFGPKCILCHNSFGKRAPTVMGTYQEVQEWFVKNPKLFNFEDPNASYFISGILGRFEDGFFSTMPYSSSTDDIFTPIPDVTDHEMEMIQEWIKRKLPFNEDEL